MKTTEVDGNKLNSYKERKGEKWLRRTEKVVEYVVGDGSNLGYLFPLCKLPSHTYDSSCNRFELLPRFIAIKVSHFCILSLLRSLHSASHIWLSLGQTAY